MCTDKDKNCEKKGGSLKCIIGGVLAGVAVGMVGKVLMDNNKKTLQKKASKVADAMENLLNTAMEMFK